MHSHQKSASGKLASAVRALKCLWHFQFLPMRPSGRAQLSWAQRTSVREPQLEPEMRR